MVSIFQELELEFSLYQKCFSEKREDSSLHHMAALRKLSTGCAWGLKFQAHILELWSGHIGLLRVRKE